MWQMYQSLLSVFALGLIPVTVMTSNAGLKASVLEVAPPAQELSFRDSFSSSGVAIFDIQSGQQVYGLQSNVRRPMASITKLMTAIIIAENHELTEVVKIPKSAAQIQGNRAYLNVGERFTVGDLLSALLITSANDAAQALAYYHSGSIDEFVTAMNERARSLGLQSTSFANPSGLDHPNQWSTPKDIAWLTLYALKNPDLSKRMSKRTQRIKSLEGTTLDVVHTHQLLHKKEAVVAGKTGTTRGAGQCLVSVVEASDSNEYLIVLLNSLQRYTDLDQIISLLSSQLTVAEAPDAPAA